jgi:flagellar basal body-associated protein FliL
MVEKAELDALEITIDEHSEDRLQDVAIPEDVTTPEKEEDGSGEKRTGGVVSRVKGWVRKPLIWMLLISVVLLCSIAGIAIYYYHGKDAKASVVEKKQAASGSPAAVEGRIALFEGFVVDQKDDKGHIRILFCDIALELEKSKPVGAVGSDRVDVRNVIYAVLKKEAVKECLTPEGRTSLKAELKNKLNSLFGDNLIESVYFMRYELI